MSVSCDWQISIQFDGSKKKKTKQKQQALGLFEFELQRSCVIEKRNLLLNNKTLAHEFHFSCLLSNICLIVLYLNFTIYYFLTAQFDILIFSLIQ